MSERRSEKRDARDVPNYTLAESARWLGLASNTLRAWLAGQNYQTKSGSKKARPVIKVADRDPLGLSFWNLVECSVLASMRKDHRISLQKVRRALEYVAEKLDQERPLIEQQFSTDGINLFVERYGKLIDVSRRGQLAMRSVLAASLTRIERDATPFASRLYPWSHRIDEPRVVSVDPRISFGRPVVASTAVPVEALLSRFRAGERISDLARDYRVERMLVEDVLRWAFEPTAA